MLYNVFLGPVEFVLALIFFIYFPVVQSLRKKNKKQTNKKTTRNCFQSQERQLQYSWKGIWSLILLIAITTTKYFNKEILASSKYHNFS